MQIIWDPSTYLKNFSNFHVKISYIKDSEVDSIISDFLVDLSRVDCRKIQLETYFQFTIVSLVCFQVSSADINDINLGKSDLRSLMKDIAEAFKSSSSSNDDASELYDFYKEVKKVCPISQKKWDFVNYFE